MDVGCDGIYVMFMYVCMYVCMYVRTYVGRKEGSEQASKHEKGREVRKKGKVKGRAFVCIVIHLRTLLYLLTLARYTLNLQACHTVSPPFSPKTPSRSPGGIINSHL